MPQEMRMARDGIWIVEEVPGVPEDERFFVSGSPFKPPFPHFNTRLKAEKFLRDQGISQWSYENFEP
jgi:hypothetical protein